MNNSIMKVKVREEEREKWVKAQIENGDQINKINKEYKQNIDNLDIRIVNDYGSGRNSPRPIVTQKDDYKL